EVETALQNWNVNLPTGLLYGPNSTYNIKASGQLMNAAEFGSIIVSYQNGRPARLDRVANVVDGIENVFNAGWFYAKDFEGGTEEVRAISLQVMRQPGTNTIEVADRVRALLPSLAARLPAAAHVMLRQDRSQTIRAAFEDIQWTMVITLV